MLHFEPLFLSVDIIKRRSIVRTHRGQ